MKFFAVLALATTAIAIPQVVAPAGCSASTSGTFQITTANVRKRDLESRQLAGALTLTLQNGILKDQAGRTGYVASNFQFQFDAPVQAGAILTSGFSLCGNGSLALSGRSTPAAIWYQCLSGNFYNLYSQSTGAQCSPIYILAVNQASGASSQRPVTQITDGQPQATSAGRVISQISDGQPQASSARNVVSQISDGQPQASSARNVITQISDGQPQAPRVTSTPRVISQISDGQPQAPRITSTPRVISQISDGQPQAPRVTSTPRVVSQISDGQPQVPVTSTRPSNLTVSTSSRTPAQFTGAAATGHIAGAGAFVAGVLGLLAYV